VNPLDLERAKTTIKRLNFIHNFCPIENKDMVYTLSLFVYELPRWINEFVWRQLMDIEIERIRMGIEAWSNSKTKFMVYNKSNLAAAAGTIRLSLSLVHSFFQLFARKIIYSLDHF
ncbi:27420_t:CDS:2, partial [Gigaspora margarita]